MFGDVIYLDNAAATRLDERVLEAMTPYFFDLYAVATSQFGYSLGVDARDALDGARAQIAARLGAEPERFVFTSGSTESSNMALKGVALALGEKKGRHIVTSPIEDFPVLNSAKALARQGFRVDYVRVDGDGRIDLDHLRDSITPETILVSIQAANQEIGTLQDMAAIAAIAHERDTCALPHRRDAFAFRACRWTCAGAGRSGDRRRAHAARAQGHRWPLRAQRHAAAQVDGRWLSGVRPARRCRGHPQRSGICQALWSW
jgi:cysteine sulfinate desulfinase/cysteine desulfurase-like protein